MLNILMHPSLITHLIIPLRFIAKGGISDSKGLNNVKDLGILQNYFPESLGHLTCLRIFDLPTLNT